MLPENWRLANKNAQSRMEGNPKKWIQSAIKKPGALHASLKIPKGKKIPTKKLQSMKHAGGKLGQRIRFALNMKKMRTK